MKPTLIVSFKPWSGSLSFYDPRPLNGICKRKLRLPFFVAVIYEYISGMKIMIINGPNLNLLGKREPEVYGSTTFEAYLEELKGSFPEVELHYFQSNIEGELIAKLQEVGFSYDGFV